ncbi:MAG: DUF4372 domain-containing protein [Deltaproteobacteria bacterium]
MYIAHSGLYLLPNNGGEVCQNAGKTVFAQVMEHLPRYEFDKSVKKYEGNHRVRRFPCNLQHCN